MRSFKLLSVEPDAPVEKSLLLDYPLEHRRKMKAVVINEYGNESVLDYTDSKKLAAVSWQ